MNTREALTNLLDDDLDRSADNVALWVSRESLDAARAALATPDPLETAARAAERALGDLLDELADTGTDTVYHPARETLAALRDALGDTL